MRHIDDDSPFLPFPFSDVSNEEWCPRPPNETQRKAARLLWEEVDLRARKLGISRRSFLRTAAGTATAFMALNCAHHIDPEGGAAPLPVSEEETLDPDAADEKFKQDFFVMDVQLHHVDLTDPRIEDQQVAYLNSCFRFLPNNLRCTPEGLELLSQANLVKEVFMDSETDVGIISGVPSSIVLGPETMAATRDLVNEITGSRRCLSQAVCGPMMPPDSDRSIQSLEFQKSELKMVNAMKVYTYEGGWWLDDEKISYPMLEEATRLGINIVNVHKGVPLGEDKWVETRDLPKVVHDWPDLVFVIYHSGYFFNRPGREIEDYLETVRSIDSKDRERLYTEIGTSFAIAFTQGPEKAAHFMGKLLKEFGPRKILWGTDSIWWGSPQWQIDAFKSLVIPESMQEEFGYPALTDDVKARILGLNAAELYGLDPVIIQDSNHKDKVADLRLEQQGAGRGRSYYVYGIRTRRDFLKMLRREQDLSSSG